ncbi:hypothetical protein [Sphingosinicella sp.]|uniref:hypothetical protein n=1 Tax=Sphingosinicella sp. TaxID=1917971 RepID=UPI0040383C85
MEQTTNPLAPEAATDEPASPFNLPDHFPENPETRLISDELNDTLAETFPPGIRKPRHDGWTPDAIAAFLHDLAAVGVVEHAARAAGLSAASAYAFRNRRQGRAFAKMWDAILVHRARARIASELQSRAVAGCVSVRKRDGEVVSEYHYHDNRLAMAMLTRLDRLAEREGESDAHLRALSEGLDDYLDCLADGGDADAFVDARRPVEPEPEVSAPLKRRDNDPELTTLARLSGCPDYLDVDPNTIDVSDIDFTRKSEWDADQWVRVYRSGLMHWLAAGGDPAGSTAGRGTALCFTFSREACRAAHEAGYDAASPGEEGIDSSDLDTAQIWDWTDDQLARAWQSRTIQRLPEDFWDDLATSEEER